MHVGACIHASCTCCLYLAKAADLCYLAFEFFFTNLLVCLFFLYIPYVVILMFNIDSSTWVAHISGALSSLGSPRYT